MEKTTQFTLKGGTLFRPESLIIKDALLFYFRGNLFSPLKYGVSVPLENIQAVQSSPGVRDIVIKSKNMNLVCRHFSEKKLNKLRDLIEQSSV
ncbi:MAG: hypothetical protein ACQESX_00050 [Bacteroidota bacterium]